MSATDDLLNKGFLLTGPAAGSAAVAAPISGRTIIVTGLRRSGTTLVASILNHVGIFMGDEINDAVFEDERIARIITAGDTQALREMIRDRDANYGTWGFKLPMLGDNMAPADVAAFNNPHVIVPFRDPIAISKRNSLSDYQQPMQALADAARQIDELVSFVTSLPCPALLLSYEKILTFPDDLLDAIMQFCGIPGNAALRASLIGLIEPNRPSYIARARRRYDGIVEAVISGHLVGWCQLTASPEAVPLELLVDGQPIRSFVADMFRQDLLDAGIGNGRHGFAVSLDALNLRHDSILAVKVSDHDVELDNSSMKLSHYQARAR